MPPYGANLLISSRLPPCLSVFKHASRISNSNGKSALRAPNYAIPVSPLAKALSHTAYLTVHNHSASPQSIILYPSPPDFSGNHSPKDVLYSVFQASRAIKPGTGSITFSLPCGPPLNWGTSLSLGIIAMLGAPGSRPLRGPTCSRPIGHFGRHPMTRARRLRTSA